MGVPNAPMLQSAQDQAAQAMSAQNLQQQKLAAGTAPMGIPRPYTGQGNDQRMMPAVAPAAVPAARNAQLANSISGVLRGGGLRGY